MSQLSRTIDMLVPSRLALAASGFAAFVVCLFANARTILVTYGLNDSSRYIGDSAGQHFLRFLSKLDSFRLTDSIVTFLVWSLVGLICLGFIQTILNVENSVAAERSFTSNDYVHPAHFNDRYFHRGIVWNIVRTLITAVISIGAILFLLGGLVPLARIYQTPAFDKPDALNIAFLAFGFVLVWGGTTLVYIAARLFVLRNRMS